MWARNSLRKYLRAVSTGFGAVWPSPHRLVFFTMSIVNILIVAVAAYKGVEYMDSPSFCGQLCHEVMEPEWAGYQEGSHARVACVQCHIGSGAADQNAMLAALGRPSLDSLIDAVVPPAIRLKKLLDLPGAVSEAEALASEQPADAEPPADVEQPAGEDVNS